MRKILRGYRSLSGEQFDPPRECIDHYQDVGVALVIDWKRTDVVYMETLEWVVECASKWMRLNEDL